MSHPSPDAIRQLLEQALGECQCQHADEQHIEITLRIPVSLATKWLHQVLMRAITK
jgi:hypothetical protein